MSQPAYLIDSHCHLHDLDFYTPEAQVQALAACAEKQVEKLICIGTDHEDFSRLPNLLPKIPPNFSGATVSTPMNLTSLEKMFNLNIKTDQSQSEKSA